VPYPYYTTKTPGLQIFIKKVKNTLDKVNEVEYNVMGKGGI
jgi:hypothetical protein